MGGYGGLGKTMSVTQEWTVQLLREWVGAGVLFLEQFTVGFSLNDEKGLAALCPGHVPGACPPCVRLVFLPAMCPPCVRRVSALCPLGVLWPCPQTLSSAVPGPGLASKPWLPFACSPCVRLLSAIVPATCPLRPRLRAFLCLPCVCVSTSV